MPTSKRKKVAAAAASKRAAADDAVEEEVFDKENDLNSSGSGKKSRGGKRKTAELEDDNDEEDDDELAEEDYVQEEEEEDQEDEEEAPHSPEPEAKRSKKKGANKKAAVASSPMKDRHINPTGKPAEAGIIDQVYVGEFVLCAMWIWGDASFRIACLELFDCIIICLLTYSSIPISNSRVTCYINIIHPQRISCAIVNSPSNSAATSTSSTDKTDPESLPSSLPSKYVSVPALAAPTVPATSKTSSAKKPAPIVPGPNYESPSSMVVPMGTNQMFTVIQSQ